MALQDSTLTFSEMNKFDVHGYLSQNLSKDIADVLLAGIDGKVFLSLNRNDVHELFPSLNQFLVRRTVLAHVKELSSDDDHVDEEVHVGSPVIQMSRVAFTLYTDTDLMKSAKTGTITKEAKDACVRGIISNMISACQELATPRYPTSPELKEMAMLMCQRFPVLKDDTTLNPEKPWEGLLFKLKRRLANKKPIVKPQGPTPKKARRQPIEQDAIEIPAEEDTSNIIMSVEVSVQEDADYDAPAMASHYTLLKKKFEDKQPNQKVIKQLLDLEFSSRQKFVESLKTNKILSVIEAYPCFLKAVHIVDELRRYISEDVDFLFKCSQRLDSLWESLFLWGIRKNLFSPSLDKTNGAREQAIFMNLTTMFPSGKKPRQALLTVLSSDESVDAQLKKIKTPALISTPTNIIVAACGQSFGILKPSSWTRSVLVLLGVHYTFMLPYAQGTESALSILQTEVLCDSIHKSDKRVQKYS